MEANGITVQYKITLKGLLKHKSNEGSGLFNHIFIALETPILRGTAAHGDIYIHRNTHEDLLGIVLEV